MLVAAKLLFWKHVGILGFWAFGWWLGSKADAGVWDFEVLHWDHNTVRL